MKSTWKDIGTAAECVEYLIGLVQRGELIQTMKTVDGMIAVVACLSKIITWVVERIGQQTRTDVIFGADGSELELVRLCTSLGMSPPREGIVDNVALAMMLRFLLAKFTEMVSEWLDEEID